MYCIRFCVLIGWKDVNCAILRKKKSLDCCDIPSFVATLIILFRNIIARCRNKDWVRLLENCKKLCRDILFMSRHYSFRSCKKLGRNILFMSQHYFI